MIRIAIRGFKGVAVSFEERIEMDMEGLSNLLPLLAEKHARAMAALELDMVEIEFLDEPDPLQRFFRIGTNPAGMVVPIAISLDKRKKKHER